MIGHDARQIANFILDVGDSSSMRFSNLALLKLIYFCHGWTLAMTNGPLIRNRIEAWKYGPVVRVVYESFKEWGDNPIEGRAYVFDPVENTREIADYSLSDTEIAVIKDVLQEHGRLDAISLSEITHSPGSPWYNIWNKSDRKVSVGLIISDESIRNFFVENMNSRIFH